MSVTFSARVRRAPARWCLLGALLVTGTGVLAACGSSAPAAAPAAGPALTAGAGQSLPGMPGASGTTGPAAAVPSGGTAMPGMTTPGMTTPGMTMPGMTMPGMTGATTAAAPAAPVAGNAVAIKNFAFAPAALTVKVGTTVTWTNQDTDAHTVTSQGTGGPLNSMPLNTGQTYSYTFTKAGTFAYLCTIHPFMTATVTVTP